MQSFFLGTPIFYYLRRSKRLCWCQKHVTELFDVSATSLIWDTSLPMFQVEQNTESDDTGEINISYDVCVILYFRLQAYPSALFTGSLQYRWVHHCVRTLSDKNQIWIVWLLLKKENSKMVYFFKCSYDRRETVLPARYRRAFLWSFTVWPLKTFKNRHCSDYSFFNKS